MRDPQAIEQHHKTLAIEFLWLYVTMGCSRECSELWGWIPIPSVVALPQAPAEKKGIHACLKDYPARTLLVAT
jgi:hypothetical protein